MGNARDPVIYISEDQVKKWQPADDVVDGPGWYFFEENWAFVQGPYDSEKEAQEACKQYAATL